MKYFKVFLILSILSCASQKKMTTPGFIPLEESTIESSITVRSTEDLGKTLIITPQSDYKSWRHMIYFTPEVNTYLVSPGDYRKWGIIRPSITGTAQSPKRIIRYSPGSKDVHPVHLKRDGGEEVIIEGFKFDKMSYWSLIGITFRGHGRPCTFW